MAKQKLYILHGWTYTVAPWEKTIELLEKKDIKVEMLHVPGLTTSSKKVWTIEEYAKWADRNLPDGAVALGHSNGGRILLNLCSEKPEKLKQLILLDAAGVYEASSKRDFIRSLSKKFSFLKKIPGMTKAWHKLTGTTDYAKAPQNMKDTLANMLESDKKLDLTKVTTPTSILWGEADRVTPPHQAAIMHEKITNSTLEIFPGWSHAPYISHPVELARAILMVLRQPPKVKPAEEMVADAAKGSAAFAIKRAEKPTLKASSEPNSVAPDVPTKLTLRKESSPTEGMVVSDAESAAVRYAAKAPRPEQKVTDTAKFSASAGFRRALSRKKPDTDAARSSASASLKKSESPKGFDNTKAKSAVFALKKTAAKVSAKGNNSTSVNALSAEPETVIPENVSFVELDPVVPAGIISSADVAPAKSGPAAKVVAKLAKTTSALSEAGAKALKSAAKPAADNSTKNLAAKPSPAAKGKA